MSFEGLTPSPDVAAGSWIGPRLNGFGGRVHCVVPDGYRAYVRIFHPASDAAGEPVPWAEVCRRTGRTPHALMQWNSIARVVVGGGIAGWSGSAPSVGNLAPDALATALEVLSGFTGADDECVHAVWEGWGWLHPGAWAVVTATDGGTPGPAPMATAGLPSAVVAGPKLELPGRAYLLFRGPLRAALRVGHQVTEDWFDPQSPSLLWPPDHSWCLATEIDFDSTLVGGPQELIDALLRVPGLETAQVEPTDDLTVAGDLINR